MLWELNKTHQGFKPETWKEGGNHKKGIISNSSHPTADSSQASTKAVYQIYMVHAKQLCQAIKAEFKKYGKRGHYQLMPKTQIVSKQSALVLVMIPFFLPLTMYPKKQY